MRASRSYMWRMDQQTPDPAPEADRQSACLQDWNGAIRRAAIRPHQAGAFPAGLSPRIRRACGRGRRHRRRCRSADLRQYHRGAGSARARRSRASSTSFNARQRPHQRRHPGDRARNGAARGQALEHASSWMRRCSAASMRSIASAASSRLTAEQRARARALSRHVQARGRRARPGRESAARRDQRAARLARHRVRPERAGGRAEHARSCSKARRTSPGFPISCARRRVQAAEERGLPASTSSRCRARASSRSCSSRRDAICARRLFAPGSRAATAAAQPTTRRSSPRWWRCAPSARGCSAMRSFAHYRLDDAMAKTPRSGARAARPRLGAGARRARSPIATRMQALVQAEGEQLRARAWDWRYYAEKLRKARCDVDEATIKPYFQLERIIEAAFYTANRLFGLTFEPRNGIPVWHPDVRVWEVRDAHGRHRGLFFGDYFARASKHSGAWMTTLARPGKARRRHPAAHRQRHELLQGGRRRADAAVLRRRAGRCSTNSATRCTACCPTSPIRRSRAPACSRTGSSCRRSSTSTGWSGRRSCAASPSITSTGEPMPEDAVATADRRAHLQPGLRDRRIRRVGAGRSRLPSAARRADEASTSLRSSRQRSRASACRARSSCATGPPISSTSSPAAAMRRPITATCGRRCSTPTPLRHSRRPATCSIRHREEAARSCLCSRRLARSGRALHRLPRPNADPDELLKRRGLGDGSAQA